jgi:hypothetical protein
MIVAFSQCGTESGDTIFILAGNLDPSSSPLETLS